MAYLVLHVDPEDGSLDYRPVANKFDALSCIPNMIRDRWTPAILVLNIRAGDVVGGWARSAQDLAYIKLYAPDQLNWYLYQEGCPHPETIDFERLDGGKDVYCLECHKAWTIPAEPERVPEPLLESKIPF